MSTPGIFFKNQEELEAPTVNALKRNTKCSYKQVKEEGRGVKGHQRREKKAKEL
jgi:hypothetical protein